MPQRLRGRGGRRKPDVKHGRSTRVNAAKDSSGSKCVLWLSTCAFTLMFNVWMMMGVLGSSVRRVLGLSDAQLEWLIAVAILAGAVFRLNFGIWADTYGGRKVTGGPVLGGAGPSYVLCQASRWCPADVSARAFGP